MNKLAASVLDDTSKINKIDKSNMLSFCVDTAKHYREAEKTAKKISLRYSKPENIIVAGMGGSAIGGELLKDWACDKAPVPIEVSRAYALPAYANEKSLVLVVSYSGETEESLSAFLDAVKRKCLIFCVSSGGSLLEFAGKLNVPYLRVPSGMPPRAALPYLFVPLLRALEKMGMVSGVSEGLSEAIKLLERVSGENAPEKPAKDNFCKSLALGIGGTVPVVYGFGVYRGVAQRFKQQFNENSKVPSKWEIFPELNHNEIVGWEGLKSLRAPVEAVVLRDRSEHSRVAKRIDITLELMRDDGVQMKEVWSEGQSLLTRIFSLIYLGDFVSIYLAALYGEDPTPVRRINELKKRLSEETNT